MNNSGKSVLSSLRREALSTVLVGLEGWMMITIIKVSYAVLLVCML